MKMFLHDAMKKFTFLYLREVVCVPGLQMPSFKIQLSKSSVKFQSEDWRPRRKISSASKWLTSTHECKSSVQRPSCCNHNDLILRTAKWNLMSDGFQFCSFASCTARISWVSGGISSGKSMLWLDVHYGSFGSCTKRCSLIVSSAFQRFLPNVTRKKNAGFFNRFLFFRQFTTLCKPPIGITSEKVSQFCVALP